MPCNKLILLSRHLWRWVGHYSKHIFCMNSISAHSISQMVAFFGMHFVASSPNSASFKHFLHFSFFIRHYISTVVCFPFLRYSASNNSPSFWDASFLSTHTVYGWLICGWMYSGSMACYGGVARAASDVSTAGTFQLILNNLVNNDLNFLCFSFLFFLLINGDNNFHFLLFLII